MSALDRVSSDSGVILDSATDLEEIPSLFHTSPFPHSFCLSCLFKLLAMEEKDCLSPQENENRIESHFHPLLLIV